METLLDIKNALKDVPDELLGNIWIGTGECSEETVSIIASEGSDKYDFPQVFRLIETEYPKLNEFNKLIEAIGKAQSILDNEDKIDPRLTEIFCEHIGEGVNSNLEKELEELRKKHKEEVKASQSKSVKE